MSFGVGYTKVTIVIIQVSGMSQADMYQALQQYQDQLAVIISFIIAR